MSQNHAALLDAHIQLSETLRDTHYGHTVTEYDCIPTSVEVAKAIGESTPFVLRGVANDWPAISPQSCSRWTNAYLESKLGDTNVTVALTGDGYADAITWVPRDGRKEVHGRVCLPPALASEPHFPRQYPNGVGVKGRGQFAFAAPFEQCVSFRTVLQHLTSTQSCMSLLATCGIASKPGAISNSLPSIAYCQLQNDCLRGPEYSVLLGDVPDVVPGWASPVLGDMPEAVNIWMGRHESVTSLHSDPFENIYTVVRGIKTFRLWPPSDGFFFHKKPFPAAKWLPCFHEDESDARENGDNVQKHGTKTRRADHEISSSCNLPRVEIVLSPESDNQFTPWIPITHPELPAPLYPRFASVLPPLIVRVHPGDSLYLPKGWLHHVEQEEDREGLCIAVNTWYEGSAGMGLSWGWSEYAAKMEELLTA